MREPGRWSARPNLTRSGPQGPLHLYWYAKLIGHLRPVFRSSSHACVIIYRGRPTPGGCYIHHHSLLKVTYLTVSQPSSV
jgi:hypothetical protein